MQTESFYAAVWEFGCCGGPLVIGGNARLLVQYEGEYADEMREKLATITSQPLAGVEAHHDDESYELTGKIIALDGLTKDSRIIPIKSVPVYDYRMDDVPPVDSQGTEETNEPTFQGYLITVQVP